MGLRFKLLIPVLLLYFCISALLHYYWVPEYLAHENKSRIEHERAYLELLGTSLTPDLLNNDLAKIYTTLDKILQGREYWHAITLYNTKQQRLYPLEVKPLTQDGTLNLFQYDINFNDENIGNLNVWVDIHTDAEKQLKHISRLEFLLLITVLVVAIAVLLLQDMLIRKPLRKLSFMATEIANGNYDSTMSYQSKDEVGRLVDSLNIMKLQIGSREKRLIESETRYKAVIDNAVDGIISIDTRGIIQSFNPAAVKIFGYKPSEAIGKNVNMLMPQPYREKHDGYLHNYLESGKKKIIGVGRQVEGIRKDGTTFPLDLAVNEVKLKDQHIFIGITRDVSERVYAANESQRYLTALEQLHDIASRLDQTFEEKVSKLLKLGQNIFKLPLAIVSRIEGETYTIEHIAGPDGAPEPGTTFPLGETYCCHTLKSNGPKGFEHAGISYINNHPCYKTFGLESYLGTPLFVGGRIYGTLNFSGPDVHKEPFTSGDYSVIQLFAQWIGTEIERAQAEKDLFNVTALRQAILDSADFSIISTGIDGTIKIFNRGAERMLGYAADEVVDKQTPAILHDADEVVAHAKTVSEELNAVIEPGFETFIAKPRIGITDENEWTYIRKDGSRFPILLSVTAVRDPGGEIIGYLGIASDLTERKKVDKMKSEFVSTVSHELRTPLTSIRGALGLVLGKFAEGLSPNVLRMLETADRNSERLTHLINDILDLEKISAGKLEFELKPLEMESIAKRAIEDNSGYAHSHNVNLRFDDDSSVHTVVRVDEHRLLQVFANLISNAVKFSPENGTVDIKIVRNNDIIRTSVFDTGPGIPAEFHSRIFGRFAQADSSDARQKGGTGLGLTISRAIIEQLGGDIGFNTRENEGTEFYFELPVWHETVIHDNETPAEILICEDDSDVAFVLARLLDEEGFTCDIAATAQSARELIDKNSYRLLLLDLKLPDSDGLVFLRELRSHDTTRELPVIVVSGTAQEGRREFNGDAVTVIDWLQKPVDREKLTRAVNANIKDSTRKKILHVEDDLDVIQVSRMLFEDEADFDFATSLSEALSKLSENDYGLVILDISLPDGNGLELIDRINMECPIVLFSGKEDVKELSDRVSATLSKASTSNSELINTVRHLLATAV